MGIRDRLAQLLREAPDEAEAIEFDGGWWHWGRMKRVAADVSAVLDRAGLGADGRVGVVLENRPEHVALLAAVLATGRCIVTLSPLQPAARLAADITRSEVPVVVGSPEVLGREGVLDAATACGAAVELSPEGAVREIGGSVPPDAAPSPGIAIEMLTSGTTGPPKRIRLSTRQLNGSIDSSGQKPRDGRLLSSSVGIVATPMVHIGGMWGAIGTLSAGRRIVLMPKFELEQWVSAVERYQLRAAGLVPAALRTVLDAAVPAERLKSLQVVTSGTTACPPELADRFFRTYGIRVLMTYGATEFAGAVAGWTYQLHKDWWDIKAGSTGRPFGDAVLRVTGTDGAELPAGETGHLEVRTRQSAQGEDAWVRTSDLARIDEDGFLWITGRADDAIVRGGFKVQPDTVRKALESHPAVREAGVAGLPDDRLGAVPVAAVELEPGVEVDETTLVPELVARCRTELTPYEVPKHIFVVDELPRTPSTKISRVDLVELIRGRLAAQTRPDPRHPTSQGGIAVTSTEEKKVGGEQFGVLTDEAIARSRLRLGIPNPQHNPPHNYEVTWDGTRHFGYGYGDDNPLWCDPDYVATTRWGGLIAPPTFLYTMGEDAAPKPDPETKALLKGDPFAGLGSYQAVMEFEWFRPLRAGDRCRVLQAQVGVQPKTSSFGGRTAHVTHDYLYANSAGEMHAVRRGTWINAERHTSKKRAKEKLVLEPYTDEQIAEIDAAYAAETRRGATPRYFEDVSVGDVLDPKVKGPLTTTDVVVWHLGWGMQLTPPGAFGIAARIRAKAPGLYPRNAMNVPDTVQRLHWDPVRAQELGLPTSYDYGGMRETWLCHLVTDWMGDDAWLWKLRCAHRKFNYTGDTTWVRGEVVDKQVTEVGNEVHLAVRCENQRGEVTTPGTAVVLLPSKDAPVTLPSPPSDDLEGMLQAELERFAI